MPFLGRPQNTLFMVTCSVIIFHWATEMGFTTLADLKDIGQLVVAESDSHR